MNRPKITRREVCAMVAEEFGITTQFLLSATRMKSVVRPRQVAMYLFVSELGKSMPDTGRYFADMDHTTVLHAIRRVPELIEKDRALAGHVEKLRRRIRTTEAALLAPPDQVEADDAAPAPAPAPVETPAQPVVVVAGRASVGKLCQAVETYLKARKRLEDDRYSAHEGPSRRNEEQALGGLGVAFHDYLAGGRAS